MDAYTCQFGVVHKGCTTKYCEVPHEVPCNMPKEHSPNTEHGVWVFRDKVIHRCIKPEYVDGVKTDDKWMCSDCEKVWTVASMWYDQRDNYTGINWKETV